MKSHCVFSDKLHVPKINENVAFHTECERARNKEEEDRPRKRKFQERLRGKPTCPDLPAVVDNEI